jgi:hypothetical protein
MLLPQVIVKKSNHKYALNRTWKLNRIWKVNQQTEEHDNKFNDDHIFLNY